MSALRSGPVERAGGARFALSGLIPAADSVVLPRFLRKPVRFFVRFCDGDYEPPRYFGRGAVALFLSSSVLYGAFLGGQIPAAAQTVTSRLGFAVDEVRISGNTQTSEIDILERLDLDGWTSLVGFDAEIARERIASLPWVRGVAVRKVYPDEIEVRVDERAAFAILQQGSNLSLIERNGDVIVPFDGRRHVTLPLLVGFGAEKGADFVEKIARYPELASRVKGYIRVADRRWDLRLENGITIRLPESGEDAALAEVLLLDRQQGLLSRDIAAVDLRLDDRVVVQLTPEAQERRAEMIAEQAKAAKRKPGTNI